MDGHIGVITVYIGMSLCPFHTYYNCTCVSDKKSSQLSEPVYATITEKMDDSGDVLMQTNAAYISTRRLKRKRLPPEPKMEINPSYIIYNKP